MLTSHTWKHLEVFFHKVIFVCQYCWPCMVKLLTAGGQKTLSSESQTTSVTTTKGITAQHESPTQEEKNVRKVYSRSEVTIIKRLNIILRGSSEKKKKRTTRHKSACGEKRQSTHRCVSRHSRHRPPSYDRVKQSSSWYEQLEKQQRLSSSHVCQPLNSCVP